MGKEKLPIDVMNFGWPHVDARCFTSPYSRIIGEVVVRGKVIIMANVLIAGDKCCPVEISPGVFIGEDVKIFGRGQKHKRSQTADFFFKRNKALVVIRSQIENINSL